MEAELDLPSVNGLLNGGGKMAATDSNLEIQSLKEEVERLNEEFKNVRTAGTINTLLAHINYMYIRFPLMIN